MKSYAQNFEDVILERLFQDRSDGFYVDVGAWDPRRRSVTRHFYDKGWHGINIEPIAEYAALFQHERDRDVSLCVAIASRGETIRMWLCEEEHFLSTTSDVHAAKLRARGLTLTERVVATRGLTAILDEFAPADIQFIKIDVEGSEVDVLATLDLERWRPQVILIEATEPAARPDWDDPDGHARRPEGEPSLLKAGYVFAYFDGLNQFYLRAEDEHLARRIQLPPGVFDNIENMDIELHDGLLARLEYSEKECAARAEVIEGLKRECAARIEVIECLEKECAARLEAIECLDAEVKRLISCRSSSLSE